MKKDMRKTYHICLSGGDELLFRSDEDYVRGFNCLALAAYETDSVILADSHMSNHLHTCVRTSDPKALVSRWRIPYSRYFNSRYERRGRLGEPDPFIVELSGFYHILTAICYILRNALHHGIAPTPFGYMHSSANSYFRKELGKFLDEALLPPRSYYKFLPRNVSCPDNYKMTEGGLLVRETVIDVADVEHMFGTPRTFLYYMNRLSSEEWMKEQAKDDNGLPPVTLETIEKGISFQSLKSMFSSEGGRCNYNTLNDIQLCDIIESKILPRFNQPSVYRMPTSDLHSAAEILRRNYHLPESQIRRCLAMV